MQCEFGDGCFHGCAKLSQSQLVLARGNIDFAQKPSSENETHVRIKFDGPINGELFRPYVEKVLVPTLQPGDIVILDNLGSHKSQAVRAAIRAAGARLLFLPAYSPDLNPIEQVFAKLKHLLRKVAESE